MDIQSIWVRYDMEKKRAYDLSFHDFIIVFYKDHLWVVDPTWQQVLPEYTRLHNDKPKVMSLNRTTRECTGKSGCPYEVKRIWKKQLSKIKKKSMISRPRTEES